MTTTMGKCISITGTHGTGKTTSAFHRAAVLKKENPTLRIGLITEIASECPLPINEKATAEAQLWIFSKQISAEIDKLVRYDLVVCDRTPVDCIAYTRVLGYDALAINMMNVIRHHIRYHTQIIFRTADRNNFCFQNNCRAHENQRFRLAVEAQLKLLYQKLHIADRIQYV